MSNLTAPTAPAFSAIYLHGNCRLDDLSPAGAAAAMVSAGQHAPSGRLAGWGLPFDVDKALVARDSEVYISLAPFQAQWLVFLHAADLSLESPVPNFAGRIDGRVGVPLANYVVYFDDGSEVKAPILSRRQVGAYWRPWGDNPMEAVAQITPRPVRAHHEQPLTGLPWGGTQTRNVIADQEPWVNWLWAWENPHPERSIVGLRVQPAGRTLVISGLSAGNASSNPLRWRPRRKALVTLPSGVAFLPDLDTNGYLEQIQLDMGHVISALPRALYPDVEWEATYNARPPEQSKDQLLVEYTSHADARFYLAGAVTVPVSEVEETRAAPGPWSLQPVPPAERRVVVRVIDAATGSPVPARLHLHGSAGEYLAPVDRHRLINPAWFEDYSVDFLHDWRHPSTYILGQTTVDLPLGSVYVEASRGFEIRPVRQVVEVTPHTSEITIAIEKVLPWREAGWVTADTHVHFLSPVSALLEGAAEGVNVVNLLAAQWGELMTNVGDFDGSTTWGAKEAGGDGEHLVRVGTENRQHMLGHISLLGYRGSIIAPMSAGGPDEASLGSPVDVLLTEWARQCREKGGLAVLPHFPDPRAEHAASIVSGHIDAVEMTSWEEFYRGIDPYSLTNWYGYLNCGYHVPCVGGTDKMTALTAIGTVRTYARLQSDAPFTYGAWMDAVRRRETFVTYGPLIDFAVNGMRMGARFSLPASGATVDVTWRAATVTVPLSRVELVVNGELRESAEAGPDSAVGSWSVRIDRSSWLALLVRGHYADRPEIIAAHSSPVMIDVAGSQLLGAADAVTILDQIEGAMAYIDTIGTRTDDRNYKRMRLVLEGAHRRLHNRLHEAGYYHEHGPATEHG